MSDFPLEFGRPWFLLLAIPAVWWTIHIARRSLAGQSEGWARFGLVLRVFLIGLLICALADVRLARTGKGLTVFFLLDRSASIPLQRSDEAYRWIAEKSASIDKDDRAGLIVYGRDASIERDAARELRMSHIESVIDRDATNTEGALLLAQAAFSSSRATGGKRVVIVSDGNTNVGDAELAARNLALSGVVVDVLPVDFSYPAEILVDGLSVPAEVHPEEPYVVSVVVHSEVATKARVQLYENDEQIATRDVDLGVGKTRVEFPTVHSDVGRYRYEARLFEIGDNQVDTLVKNNVGYGFTVIRGESRVLFVGDEGEHSTLINALRSSRIELEVVGPDEVPQDSEEYFFYDSIILGNVAAFELGVDTMRLIHGVVKNLGVGLLMVGGPDSFGAGGFKGTPIEKLLPVEMDVKQRKTIPNGALVMVLHTCEFPQGNMWAKRIAVRAVEALTREDFVGVLQWDSMGGDAWGVPFQQANDKAGIAERIRKLQPQDMQSFGPTLTQALGKLQTAPAVQKHVLIISDGDPSAPSAATMQGYIDAKISISTICIGPHGARDTGMLKKLAKDTNGRYYFVEDPEALPGIFMREALHVRRNLINEETFTPAIALETPPISGLSAIGFPPLHGYVITTPKPTAEIPLVSHEPHQDPVLAHWRYGLARTAAFTPDSGGRWTTDWTGWPGYEPFFAQLVRYVSKRGGGDFFRVERTIDGDRGRIIVDALDPDGRYLDDLAIKGRLLDPKMDEQEVSLQQVGPGRYEAEFSARRAGSYLLSLEYDDGAGLEGHYQTGINVSYSPEYRHLVSNREKLEALAAASGGRVLTAADDPFDPEVPYQKSRLPLWEEILRIATVLFFLDVFCRRVLLSLEPAKRAVAWLRRRRDTKAESTVTLSALLERQQEVRKETSGPGDRKKKRIEIARPDGEEPPAVASGPSVAPKPKATAEEPAPGPSSFTDRLLEAKRKAREDLKDDEG